MLDTRMGWWWGEGKSLPLIVCHPRVETAAAFPLQIPHGVFALSILPVKCSSPHWGYRMTGDCGLPLINSTSSLAQLSILLAEGRERLGKLWNARVLGARSWNSILESKGGERRGDYEWAEALSTASLKHPPWSHKALLTQWKFKHKIIKNVKTVATLKPKCKCRALLSTGLCATIMKPALHSWDFTQSKSRVFTRLSRVSCPTLTETTLFSFLSSHRSLYTAPRTHKAHSLLRANALVILSGWNILPLFTFTRAHVLNSIKYL